MKNHLLPFPFFVLFACCVFSPQFLNAQSVTMGAVPGKSFCSGDPIAVSFRATGFFGHRNAFDLQLSDPTGSFANGFQNIGSLIDTLPGTFMITTTIPPTITTSLHYRFRILAAIPYIPSADNGSDISIGQRPDYVQFEDAPLAVEVGTAVSFAARIGGGTSSDSIFWDFGSGANPATKADIVIDDYQTRASTVYSTTGNKTITVSVVAIGGCSRSAIFSVHVYDCSIPIIPHDAIVVNSDTTISMNNAAFWVNPGFTLSLSSSKDTVYAEPGSTVNSANEGLLFMKHGSVLLKSYGGNVVIYADGASISRNYDDYAFHCPTLDFDYTNAPPNAAHPLSVKNNLTLPTITLSPNPTTGILTIQGAPSNDLNVTVLNLLGATVMEPKNLHSSDFTLDLSKLVPGTYYIRFSSANSVVTKAIIKN